MLVELLVAAVIIILILWLISILPVPASNFPIKTILYVVVVIAAIVYLLRFLR